MELDSYYDGVHGWSGDRPRVDADDRTGRHLRRPLHAAARRHVHLSHAPARLASAVLRAVRRDDRARAGETFDPAPTTCSCSAARRDRRGRHRLSDAASVVLNGERAPRFVWKAGRAPSRPADQHHADDIFTVSVHRRTKARRVDAAHQGRRAAAARRPCDPGRPARPSPSAKPTTSSTRRRAAAGTCWLEVRTPAGKWQAAGARHREIAPRCRGKSPSRPGRLPAAAAACSSRRPSRRSSLQVGYPVYPLTSPMFRPSAAVLCVVLAGAACRSGGAASTPILQPGAPRRRPTACSPPRPPPTCRRCRHGRRREVHAGHDRPPRAGARDGGADRDAHPQRRT